MKNKKSLYMYIKNINFCTLFNVYMCFEGEKTVGLRIYIASMQVFKGNCDDLQSEQENT